MFLDIDKKCKDNMAIIDSEGLKATYGQIQEFSNRFKEKVGERTLIFILNNNSVGAGMGYLASLSQHIVPLMLGKSMDRELLYNLIDIYKPKYLWIPKDNIEEFKFEFIFKEYGYALIKTGLTTEPMNEDLSLLLTTSGSTGSPKLVRHSYNNVEANARNIANFLELDENEKPMLDLPINYTYGLSVFTSHIYAGATVLLTSCTALDMKYWNFFKENGATSITGVPYNYELLKKLRFFRMDLPSLKTISQGGGKLPESLYMEYATYAKETNRRFIPTYGQTEGTARMAYLSADRAMEKCGSIGKAIPNGKMYLVDENNQVIEESNTVGEMVYEGPNVTLGYAQCGEDLIKGDERHGILYTGDMAKMDEEGYIYIIGRKKRFLKLFGYRVSLDESERLIQGEFNTECACVGDDHGMKIFITNGQIEEEVHKFIARKTNINSSAFTIEVIEKLPRNEAGKILYSKLQ